MFFFKMNKIQASFLIFLILFVLVQKGNNHYYSKVFKYLSFSNLHLGNSLECYACENQDSNKDKCIKTSIQCEEHMDMCMTEVKWGCKLFPLLSFSFKDFSPIMNYIYVV